MLARDCKCDLIRLERTNMVTKMEDRIKIDLVAMSGLILDQLQSCDLESLSRTPEMISRLATQFNQGALLQYQYGDIEKAEQLCKAEIELFAQLSSHSPHRDLCLASIIAPYINLARIYGQKGEVRESLSIFEDIYRFGHAQQDLYIFGHRISGADAPSMITASSPGFRKLLLSCRVVESARVLQTVEDYPALLKLVTSNKHLPEYQDVFFQQYLLELRSRALLAMGQFEAAMAALEECCRLMSSTNTDRIVAHLLLSQIYRESSRKGAAAATLDKLEEHLAAVAQYVRRLPVLRQIAYRLALERHAMGDNAKALKSGEQAFAWCNELNDEPGKIKTAILLLRITGASCAYREAQRQWFDTLLELASTTFFRLERACGYWELGFLERSYDLYRSIPFVDSRRSAEVVKRSLDAGNLPAETIHHNSSIESTFEALMEFAPRSTCLVQA